MSGIVIGMDVDGVLANFNEGFRRKFIAVTGEDRFHEGPFVNGLEPPCWNYPTEAYGYTKDQTSAVWKEIVASQTFWRDLHPLPNAEEINRMLFRRLHQGDSIYFLTTRAGKFVQDQSRFWLERVMGFINPSVIICDDKKGKGGLAHGLGITHFFDDKPENCVSVKQESPKTHVFLVTARYNEWAHGEMEEKGIEIINNPASVLRSL